MHDMMLMHSTCILPWRFSILYNHIRHRVQSAVISLRQAQGHMNLDMNKQVSPRWALRESLMSNGLKGSRSAPEEALQMPPKAGSGPLQPSSGVLLR